MDENFVAKLHDVGSVVELDAGSVLLDYGEGAWALFLVLQGVLRVETLDGDEYERGAGAAIGYVEKLDENVMIVAETEARVLVVSRSDYEAALTG